MLKFQQHKMYARLNQIYVWFLGNSQETLQISSLFIIALQIDEIYCAGLNKCSCGTDAFPNNEDTEHFVYLSIFI